MAIFIDFFRFFIDFRRISEGFWKDFGDIFRWFFAFSAKTPIFKIRAPTQCFVRVELLEIHEKRQKSRYTIKAKFGCEKKSSKIAKKVDLGGSWAPFGRDLGRSEASFGRSWAVWEALFLMLVFGVVFKSALGAVWPGFWFDFNGFWEDFGKVLEGLGRMCEHSGWFWAFVDYSGLLGCFGQIFARFWLVLLVAMEFILTSSSSWLYCLFLLSFACFGLLGLALACFGCFGCLP